MSTILEAELAVEGQREPDQPVASPERQRGPLKRAVSVVVTAAMLVLLGVGVVLAVIPALKGGAALTVLTGSMRPTIQPGDVAVVFPVSSFDEIQIDDIVTFMPNPDDPTLVSHRAVGWSTDGDGQKLLITKGDANTATDQPIHEKQVRAKVAYVVPWVGNVLQYSNFSKPFIVVAIALILIGYAIYATVSSVRKHE